MRICFWKRLTALLVCLCLLPLAGLAATKTEFTVTLDVNPDASENHKDLAKDLKSVLQMTKINGTLYLADETPIWENPTFRLEGALNIKKRDYVTASLWGQESGFNAACSALGSNVFGMWMGHWYAFICKFNHFMGLDLVPLAYLAYPNGTYSAWKPVMDVLTKMENAALENGGSLSGDEAAEYAQQIADLSWENWDLYQWISYFLKDKGVNEELGWCMEELGDWVADLTSDEGLTVEKDDSHCVWTLGGMEVYRYEKDATGSRWAITFPEKTGYRMTMSRSWQESEKGADLAFNVTVLLEDGETLFGADLAASGLPCEGCTAAEGKLTASVAGELYGDAWVSVGYDWQNDGNKTNANARLLAADGVTVMGSVSADWTVSDCPEGFDATLADGTYDVMGVSDSTAPEFIAMVKTPLTKCASAFMMILPRSIINFAGDLLDKYGILTILESGTLGGLGE